MSENKMLALTIKHRELIKKLEESQSFSSEEKEILESLIILVDEYNHSKKDSADNQ